MSTPVTVTKSLPTEWLSRHRQTLDGAVSAIKTRDYFSAYAEAPGSYGENAASDGEAAFSSHLNRHFELDQPDRDAWAGGEHSPYGFNLGVEYPRPNLDRLIEGARSALPAWRDLGADARTGVCLEILSRLNSRSHEIAHAVMHTTGQAFPMAFQAGGPHAQDRGLEALAYASEAMALTPSAARWEKPQGKREPVRLQKIFTVAPRGIALVIGCNTFPTWNSYPGLFASLVTGNPVIVKPSRRAVLPLAITVAVAQDVLKEAGLSPNLVTLAAEVPAERLASVLATRPEVRIIDYTGSGQFGNWLERNAFQAQVFTEKSGVNGLVLESANDYRAMLQNLAFTLSLYSGQMCTTTQNIFVPRDGIDTDLGHQTFEQVGEDLGAAINDLLSDPRRAMTILGAIVNDEVLARIEGADRLGRILLASKTIEHPEYPTATILVAAQGVDDPAVMTEQFGPITLLIPTDGVEHAVAALRQTVLAHGAITAGVYSTKESVLRAVREAAIESGVALSENLVGPIYLNQSAAFSDFHATGLNPAANASLTDLAFVTPRFHVVQSRSLVTSAPAT
jgi:phenylacetic acid degradation protein paaN